MLQSQEGTSGGKSAAGLLRLDGNKYNASCQQACCKFFIRLIETCYPQACRKLLQPLAKSAYIKLHQI